MIFEASAAVDLPLLTTGSSSSGLYPSFSIRSASSLAFFSAASKSKPSVAVIFFAPSLFFFAPRMFALRGAVEDAVFLIAEVGMAFAVVVVVASVPDRGDFGLAGPFPLAGALRNGDPVLEPTGGVAVREGGLLGRLIVGLSHDVKKSSSCSAGVALPESGSGMSVMTHSSG